jgi:predicted O-methyltransferase YrrM
VIKYQDREIITEHLEIETRRIAKLKCQFLGGDLLRWSIDCTHKICHKTAFLYLICQEYRPEIVVETGVAAGASSAFILASLEKNDSGMLYSVDLPNKRYFNPTSGTIHNDDLPENAETGFAIPSRLKTRWNLTLGDTRQALSALLKKLGQIDVFFHDSEHTYDAMMFEYETVWPYIRKGGLLISDDATWNEAFADFAKRRNISYEIYQDRGLIRKEQ